MTANVLTFPQSAPAGPPVHPARYVTIELAAVLTGFTPGAIRQKIATGVWLKDRQYVKREGRVLIDMRGYEKWVEVGQA